MDCENRNDLEDNTDWEKHIDREFVYWDAAENCVDFEKWNNWGNCNDWKILINWRNLQIKK